jgi:hypothetical protein
VFPLGWLGTSCAWGAYVTRRDDYAQYPVSQVISYWRDTLPSTPHLGSPLRAYRRWLLRPLRPNFLDIKPSGLVTGPRRRPSSLLRAEASAKDGTSANLQSFHSLRDAAAQDGFVRSLHGGCVPQSEGSAARTRRSGRLRAELVCGAGRGVRVAPALHHQRTSGTGSVDPCRRACPPRLQRAAIGQRGRIFDRAESSGWLASGADFAKAIPLRVDDPRSPVELGSVVAAFELVGVTEIL